MPKRLWAHLYEDNGGGLTWALFTRGKPVRIIPGFEEMKSGTFPADAIVLSRCILAGNWDSVEHWNLNIEPANPEAAYREIQLHLKRGTIRLIACIHNGDAVPREPGAAGRYYIFGEEGE